MLETLKFRYGRNAPYIRAVMYFMKFAFALVLINAAFAQQSIPAFDVVSIRPAISSRALAGPVRTATSADRVDFVNVSLDDVLMRAYGITRSQIASLPIGCLPIALISARHFPKAASRSRFRACWHGCCRTVFICCSKGESTAGLLCPDGWQERSKAEEIDKRFNREFT